MSRPLYIWLSFAACVALVLGSMGWASITVIKLDDEGASARQHAVLEENVRLALWRMDSSIAPLIGRENARPYYVYNAFYPVQRAYTRMFSKVQRGDILMPSPLLTENNPEVLIHFQYRPGRELSSPQVPTGNMLDLAESGYTSHDKILEARERLKLLDDLLDRTSLQAALPVTREKEQPLVAMAGDPQEASQGAPEPSEEVWNQKRNKQGKKVRGRRYPQAQQALSNMEWRSRLSTTAQVANEPAMANAFANSDGGLLTGMIQSIWMQEALLLARRVSVQGAEYFQGCWLDWPALKSKLLGDIKYLLPAARLEPAIGKGIGKPTRRLASLPVMLIPGALGSEDLVGLSPIQISLIIAWACVLLAAIAVGVLLRGAVVLSERRGAFVSAVTHELRTPLTTFRMYTEMLAEGMVTDEQKRSGYLRTLHAEADRLDHLVQNVLAYARLERSRSGGEIQEVGLSGLMERIQERLAERARQAGMQLEVEFSDAALSIRVRADVSATERILFNLVDNASKYAASAEDKRIHLRAEQAGKHLALSVRDHGSGIGSDVVHRLFKPFSKSAKDAAESAPGVGLGLALSRRLAVKMGGDLRADLEVPDGARFVLTLPVAG